jgi:hypothetical protein
VFIIPWCWWWWVLGCRSNWQILLLRKCATRAWYPDILRRCAVRRAPCLAFCQGRRPHDCFVIASAGCKGVPPLSPTDNKRLVLPTRPPTGFAHTLSLSPWLGVSGSVWHTETWDPTVKVVLPTQAAWSSLPTQMLRQLHPQRLQDCNLQICLLTNWIQIGF